MILDPVKFTININIRNLGCGVMNLTKKKNFFFERIVAFWSCGFENLGNSLGRYILRDIIQMCDVASGGQGYICSCETNLVVCDTHPYVPLFFMA